MSGQRYLVTARKYRPQTFDDLVAQEHVTETLKNAIRLDRLAHAYLFSGPRGVGKTTAARILAKAINCTAPSAERTDGTEPCRQCDSCKSFEEGRSMSIFETDAASNNKVEDIRELRESVRIPPQGSQKKVYIMDEVHMLSNAAFNALLKTLEEPPPYVLFIFATTEPHKVLPTILSRCQRFDFRRIPVPDVVARLESICENEGITADEASLMLIARKGDGALRDSLSVFDQAVSLCGTNLEYAELAHALGVVDVDHYFDVTSNVLRRDSAAMLHLVDGIISAGHDLPEFLGGLAEHVRNLLVGTTTGQAALIEATEAMRQRYVEESARFQETDLLRLLSIISDAEVSLRTSLQPRLKIELALLKMASLTRTEDLRTILDRLDSIPRESQFAGPDQPKSSPRPKPTAPAPRGQSRDDEGGVPAPNPEPPTAPPAGPPGLTRAPSKPAPNPGRSSGDENVRSKVFSEPALKRRRGGGNDPENVLSAQNGDGSSLGAAPAQPTLDETELETVWLDVIEQTVDRPRFSAMIRQAVPRNLSRGILSVAVPNELCSSALNTDEDDLIEILQHVCEHAVDRLEITLDASLTPIDVDETGPTVDPYEYLREKRSEHPVLKVLFDEFGGEIVS